jgi:hypothetical protein
MIQTKIQLSSDKKTWDVLLSKDGINFHFYKTFKSDKDAVKETVSIKGHYRLISDLKK